jgi:hypothetical protein
MLRRFIAVAALAVSFLLLAPMTAAFADNCFNLSRSSGGLSSNPADFSQPVIKGGWVWLPSVGVPQASWGKEVPANFQNGKSDWLLGGTPYCDAGGATNPDGTPRQDTHGVQSGCGFF